MKENLTVLRRYIGICYSFAITLVVCIGLNTLGKYFFYIMSPKDLIYERCLDVLWIVSWFVFADNNFNFS